MKFQEDNWIFFCSPIRIVCAISKELWFSYIYPFQNQNRHMFDIKIDDTAYENYSRIESVKSVSFKWKMRGKRKIK